MTPAESRRKMIDEHVRARGVTDARVLAALDKVPREIFVPAELHAQAYEDRPLPIGGGQTISQPYIVARMLELCELRGGERVLEVGAGSGYASALLAQLCAAVYAVEIVPHLAEMARGNLDRLRRLGALPAPVVVELRDGSVGWPEHAPYDAIVVSAGAPKLPALLLAQLADGGRLVAPVGERDDQTLFVVERHGDEYETRSAGPVRFVDLRGRYGWGGVGSAQA